MARRQAGALDEWRIDHLADPASSPARQALFDLCRDDPTRSLHALRASQPKRDSPLQEPISHTSAAVFPHPRPPLQIPQTQIRQSPVPGIWIFQYPRCPWLQQIYTPFSNVSHWDTGAVNVQGREAHMVARQIESTRSRPLVPETPSPIRDAVNATPFTPSPRFIPLHGDAQKSQLRPRPRRPILLTAPVIFQPWRRLTRKSVKASSLCAVGWESTFAVAPRGGALADAFHTGAGMPQPDRRRYILLRCPFSPRFTSCCQIASRMIIHLLEQLFYASSPTGPSAHTT